MKILIALATILLLASCATTRQQPTFIDYLSVGDDQFPSQSPPP